MLEPFKPTKEQLEAAVNRRVPDVIGPDLDVLFVGINPGLYTAAVGHAFAHPGNRFWPAMHGGGFTDRRWSAFEDRRLLEVGCGLTNIVARPTARASELSRVELEAGARRLVRKVRRFRPRCVAFVGLGAYRTAFARPKAVVGRQEQTIGSAMIWLLPNTSGLNAHYLPKQLARLFADLKKAVSCGF